MILSRLAESLQGKGMVTQAIAEFKRTVLAYTCYLL